MTRPLIPAPASVVWSPETPPVALRHWQVAAPLEQAAPAVAALERWLGPASDAGRPVRFLAAGKTSAVGSYRLTVDDDGVTLLAGDTDGFRHAAATLTQLVDEHGEAPACRIEDAPRFTWRGLMIDTVRHFMPLAFLLSLCDELARLKLNTLHLHLTDDQGWRLEIERHPELVAKGSRRSCTMAGHLEEGRYDDSPYSGHYTQEEMRQLVAYAAGLGINVVPEIEMPGHARAALAAHPELSCTGNPGDVACGWGIFKDVYCAGNNDVFRLLYDVLEEVLAIFPSPFIHIGGDECPKDRWQACPRCQERMRTEGLADEEALQSWFVRQVDAWLTSRGRRLVGWDEILEGGLAPGATVMAWRGEDGALAAARAGHDTIYASTAYCYFDYYQSEDRTKEPLAIGGYLPLEKVHAAWPVPPALTAEQARHVLGMQAQLWTEYIPTPAQAGYQLFPRLLALAEVAWGKYGGNDFDAFVQNVAPHLAGLERRGFTVRHLTKD